MIEKGLKSVLVIEDEPIILLSLTQFLEGENYSVLAAENGLVALEQLKKHGTPHLILLDLIMPIMNGSQFASKFHEHYGLSTPIVVMSAAGDCAQRAVVDHAVAWISKPFDLNDLLKIVRKYTS